MTRPALNIRAERVANVPWIAAPDSYGIAWLDLGIDRGHMPGREDIGKKQCLHVAHVVRHLDRVASGV